MSAALELVELGFPWEGIDPFIFTVHHVDLSAVSSLRVFETIRTTRAAPRRQAQQEPGQDRNRIPVMFHFR